MIRKIKPKCLRNNLWRPGPYMLFFSGNNKDINSDVVKNIYEISKKYILITVLEVDWDEYYEFEENVSTNGMANVLIYFRGKLEISEKYPNFKRIEELFEKCKYFYNMGFQGCYENNFKIYKNPESVKNEKKPKIIKPLTNEQRMRKIYRSKFCIRQRANKIYQPKISYNMRSYIISLIDSKIGNKTTLSDHKLNHNGAIEKSKNFNCEIPIHIKPLNDHINAINTNCKSKYIQMNSIIDKKHTMLNQFNNKYYKKCNITINSQINYQENINDTLENNLNVMDSYISDFNSHDPNNIIQSMTIPYTKNDQKLAFDKNSSNEKPNINNQQTYFNNQLSYNTNDQYLTNEPYMDNLKIKKDRFLKTYEQSFDSNNGNNQINLCQTKLPHMLYCNKPFI